MDMRTMKSGDVRGGEMKGSKLNLICLKIARMFVVLLMMFHATASSAITPATTPATVQGFTCYMGDGTSVPGSIDFNACGVLFQAYQGGIHYRFCINNGGSFVFFTRTYPNGQLSTIGAQCSFSAGGGWWVRPIYSCLNGQLTSDGMCEAPCSVDPLVPIDPAVQPYEDGLIDMDNVMQATRDGAVCIVRATRVRRINPQIQSGYRPSAYQTHIREVYDKWQLLENNNEAACADIKRQVKNEFDHHGPFAHQPGVTSRHSSGRAVDISLSDYTDADTTAERCNMSRPVPNDRSHFEPSR